MTPCFTVRVARRHRSDAAWKRSFILGMRMTIGLRDDAFDHAPLAQRQRAVQAVVDFGVRIDAE